MLILPDPSDENPCVVGLDPGSTNLGVCVLYFDPDTYVPSRIISRTYRGDKLGMLEWESLVHGERYARINALKRAVVAVLREHNPVFVGSESSFYTQKRPSAFKALIEVICAMRDACEQYSPYVPLHPIEPSLVKNALGAKGGVNKDSVKAAILKNEEIVSAMEIAIEGLDEHSIDATGVAYAMLSRIKLGEPITKE
jgi:Holliday junction resolvasome RuvABC endonuclease subunit